MYVLRSSIVPKLVEFSTDFIVAPLGVTAWSLAIIDLFDPYRYCPRKSGWFLVIEGPNTVHGRPPVGHDTGGGPRLGSDLTEEFPQRLFERHR